MSNLAKEYSFLLLDVDEGNKYVEVSDLNKHKVTQNSVLILIRKEYVKFKLALENKEQLVMVAQTENNLTASAIQLQDKTCVEEEKASEKVSKRALNFMQRDDVDMVSSSDSDSIDENQSFHKVCKPEVENYNLAMLADP